MTERHGSKVTKGKFDTLDQALEHARERVDAALREDRLGTVRMLRDFTPDQRVASRVEVSGMKLVRGPEAGIDVMGDGAVVVYRGAIRKQPLEADTLDEAFARLRSSLAA
ncbi:MAG TPA: hypothetical protein VE523_11470 [Solirubrobacterales bacterium]|nr:hypothetical protein [Solirubrobacterales bacterium]